MMDPVTIAIVAAAASGIASIVSGGFTERLAKAVKKKKRRGSARIEIRDSKGTVVGVLNDVDDEQIAHEIAAQLRISDPVELRVERSEEKAHDD